MFTETLYLLYFILCLNGPQCPVRGQKRRWNLRRPQGECGNWDSDSDSSGCKPNILHFQGSCWRFLQEGQTEWRMFPNAFFLLTQVWAPRKLGSLGAYSQRRTAWSPESSLVTGVWEFLHSGSGEGSSIARKQFLLCRRNSIRADRDSLCPVSKEEAIPGRQMKRWRRQPKLTPQVHPNTSTGLCLCFLLHYQVLLTFNEMESFLFFVNYLPESRNMYYILVHIYICTKILRFMCITHL